MSSAPAPRTMLRTVASHLLPTKLSLAAAVVGLTYLAGTRTGVESIDTGDGAPTLILWRTTAAAAPLIAAFMVWSALAAWSRRARESGGPRTWSVIATLCAAGGAWIIGSYDPFGDWTLGPPVAASDGSAYRPAWTWWTIAIVREESVSWDRETASIVATAGTDSPRRYAVLISPQRGTALGLVEGADGTLVLAQEPHCHVAFNLRSKRALTRDDLAALSPFMLLGAFGSA